MYGSNAIYFVTSLEFKSDTGLNDLNIKSALNIVERMKIASHSHGRYHIFHK